MRFKSSGARAPRRPRAVAPSLEVQAALAARQPAPARAARLGWLESLQRSPAYGAAAFFHVLLLVALSFWTIANHIEKEASVDVRMKPSKTVLPTDALDERLAAQAAAEQSLEAALAGAVSDSPFAEAEGEVAGALRGQASRVLGLAGGQGGGLGRGGSGGESGGSRRAVHAGLDWLVRHRTGDGAWKGLDEGHSDPGSIPASGGDVGQTGLALLCFLCAGEGPDKEGPYREVVQAARSWLLSRVGAGDFGQPKFNHLSTYYERAIGTLALSEWLQRAPRDEEVREALRLCVAHLSASRDPRFGGWRYYPASGSDTSVTSWVILALKSAQHAEIEVPVENFEGARIWLEHATNKTTGTTGYVAVGDGRENRAMTATGLFLRTLLGEDPRSAVNRLAVGHVERIRVSAGGGPVSNLYEVYYGALAMYQVGGRAWRRFNPAIRDALVSAQGGGGCERGGWRGAPPWVTEPVSATCFAILTLETYYRYLPQGSPTAAGLGERALEEAQSLLAELEEHERQTTGKDPARALAAQAGFARAIRILEGEGGADWDLLIEARLGLAQLAARGGDLTAALAELERAKSLVPSGELAPSALAERERSLRLGIAVQEAERALAGARGVVGREDASAEQRQVALQGVLQARSELVKRAALAPLDAEGRQALRDLANALEAAASVLVESADRDAMIEAELVRLAARRDQPAILDAGERRLLLLLLQRTHQRYQQAQSERSLARFLQAEADRQALGELNPVERGGAAELERIEPALVAIELARAGALVGLGRHEDALATLEAAQGRAPRGSPSRADAELLERALLLSLARPASDLSPPRRARLEALLAAAPGGSLSEREQLTWAELLLTRGELREAARRYQALIGPEPSPLRIEAQLGAARAHRQAKDLAAATAALADVSPQDASRLDVIEERCLVLRARGEHETAIGEYVLVLNALEHEEPLTWWRLSEELARAFVEAGRYREARRFLEGLRTRDRDFGGDPVRRARFVQLMREVDLLAGREED